MPGERSEVSKVSMTMPVHSDIAKQDKNPTSRAKIVGTPISIGGPEDTAA
jgi:hypothetical protein